MLTQQQQLLLLWPTELHNEWGTLQQEKPRCDVQKELSAAFVFVLTLLGSHFPSQLCFYLFCFTIWAVCRWEICRSCQGIKLLSWFRPRWPDCTMLHYVRHLDVIISCSKSSFESPAAHSLMGSSSVLWQKQQVCSEVCSQVLLYFFHTWHIWTNGSSFSKSGSFGISSHGRVLTCWFSQGYSWQ